MSPLLLLLVLLVVAYIGGHWAAAPGKRAFGTASGVEYVVPYSVRPRDAQPPTILGQELKRSDGLQIWYLHVWVWKENPNGLFADWNPTFSCKR